MLGVWGRPLGGTCQMVSKVTVSNNRLKKRYMEAVWVQSLFIITLVDRCEYLLQEKGQEFVQQIQARFPRLFEQVN